MLTLQQGSRIFLCTVNRGIFETRQIGLASNGHYQSNRCIGLGGKTSTQKTLSCDTLEMYDETPIFITIDITEESVESVA